MKILIISDFGFNNGGNSKIAIETALSLSLKGHSVFFFCGCGPIDDRIKNSDIKSKCLNKKEFIKYDNKFIGMREGIYSKNNYEELRLFIQSIGEKNLLVHVHSWIKVLSCSIFDAIKDLSVIITNHDYFLKCANGGFFNYKKNKCCSLKCGTAKCIVSNCDSRNYAYKLYRIIRFYKQEKIINKVKKLNCIYLSSLSKKVLTGRENYLNNEFFLENYDSFDRSHERIKVELNNKLIYIGRISREKGIYDFCDIVTHENISARVVGEGPLLDELISKYPNIEFTGWKNSSEFKKLLADVRAFVFPTMWYECSPLIIKEIMSFGVPVITTNVNAGVKDIKNNVNGIIYDSTNKQDLIDKLHKVFCDDYFVKSLSLSCYDNYDKNRVTIDKFVSSNEKIYEGILNES